MRIKEINATKKLDARRASGTMKLGAKKKCKVNVLKRRKVFPLKVPTDNTRTNRGRNKDKIGKSTKEWKQ